MVVAHVGQCRKAADAGHVQVEKQQVRIRMRFHDLVQAAKTVRFVNLRTRHAIVNRVNQCLPEERMIIRNDEVTVVG